MTLVESGSILYREKTSRCGRADQQGLAKGSMVQLWSSERGKRFAMIGLIFCCWRRFRRAMKSWRNQAGFSRLRVWILWLPEWDGGDCHWSHPPSALISECVRCLSKCQRVRTSSRTSAYGGILHRPRVRVPSLPPKLSIARIGADG